jgi:hypothetical protein
MDTHTHGKEKPKRNGILAGYALLLFTIGCSSQIVDDTTLLEVS